MKLPVVSGQQILKALTKEGFSLISQKGSHLKLRRLDPNRVKITLVVPKHRALKRGTLNAILKQANLKLERFIELLS